MEVLSIIASLAVAADVTFVDATAACGLAHVHHDAPPVPPLLPGQNTRFGIGAAVGDYDRDGDHDVYLPDSFGHPSRLFRNDGGTFTDVTEAAGVGDLGMGHMALFVDLDNDGFADLVVVNDCSDQSALFPCSQIYRNGGDGTFTNVTKGSGFAPVEPTMGGLAAGDYDRDGDLDLIAVGWFTSTRNLYRNEGGFRFTDATDDADAVVPGDRDQWTPLFVDADADGWLDVFCAVDFSEDYLIRNQGDGTFTDWSEEANTLHVANDMGVAYADFDGDGDVDLYTTNISGDKQWEDPDGDNYLYVNDGTGRFEDAAGEYGVGDTRWGWGTWFFDADLDGDLDLLAVNGWTQPEWITPATFFRNDGGAYVEAAAESGIAHDANSRGLTPLDLEGDGDVDFIIGDVLGPVAVYENRTPRGDNRWLVVTAEGTESNRDGIGSIVDVTAGGVARRAWILAGGSFYSAPPLEAHFGLGAVETVERIEVTFPSGRRAVIEDVGPDQRVHVLEPPAPCPGDADGDGAIGFADLLRLLADWGPCAGCAIDIDGDGAVGANDLDALLASWGAC
jgi:hypothetical protein